MLQIIENWKIERGQVNQNQQTFRVKLEICANCNLSITHNISFFDSIIFLESNGIKIN